MAENDEKDAITGTNTPLTGASTGAPSPSIPGDGALTPPVPVVPTPASRAPIPPDTSPKGAAPPAAASTEAPTSPSPSVTPSAQQPAAPTPAVPPANIQGAPSVEPSIQSDIARILATAQLPERREVEKGKASTGSKKTYDTALGATPTPVPEEPRRITPEAPAHKDALATVHTLKHDLQEVVRDQKISRVRAAAIETAKRRPEPIEEMLPKKAPSRGVPLAIIALLFLGIAALGGVYFFALSQVPANTPQASDSLVFAEAARTLPIDGKPAGSIKQDLALLRQEQGSVLGSITRIIPIYGGGAPGSERAATTREFLNAIGAKAPEELLRALSDNFFLGTHTVDENAPLMVIPVISYDRAFAGMLAWEDTINADFAPFFTPLAPLVVGEGGIVSARVFSDDVNRNYSVRILKDDGGAIQMYYSFPTRGMLVIAESPYTLSEAVTRLQAARRL